MGNDGDLESKFLKSGRNRQTENAGLAVLLRDPRHQAVSRDLKRTILAGLGVAGAPVQAFDAVRTMVPSGPLTALTLGPHLSDIRLIEMKTTRKPIRDDRLEGFFFGVTESEMTLAGRLRDRYLFAFVVLNAANVYGAEFFVLLTAAQLELRIHSKRTQYQVTLSRGHSDLLEAFGTGPGELLRISADDGLGIVVGGIDGLAPNLTPKRQSRPVD